MQRPEIFIGGRPAPLPMLARICEGHVLNEINLAGFGSIGEVRPFADEDTWSNRSAGFSEQEHEP
jgi:hypothetical protein